MALHWRPVGPEPEQTYWRRRAALAIALVLLIALLVTQLTGRDEPDRLGTEQPAPSAASGSPTTPTPSASVTASASASPRPPAAAACPAAGLQIEATSDRDSYPVGGRPQLELRVTNTGSAPCTVDLGSAAVELLIFSGADRIWSSDDCSGAAAKPTTLQPGKAVPTRLTWAGRRSLPGCEGPKAQALPGTYRISGRVGDVRVEGGSFSFTD